MKKKISLLLFVLVCTLCFTFGLAACEDGSPSAPVAVSSVTLDASEITLETGNTQTLTATVLPIDAAANKAVTWSSDKLTVASVDQSGKVTALAQGTAVITATVGGKSATCTVTVTEKAVDLAGKVFVYKAGSAHYLYEDGTTAPAGDFVETNKNGETVSFRKTAGAEEIVFGNVNSEGENAYTVVHEGNTVVYTEGEKSDQVDYSVTCTITVFEKKLLFLITYGRDVGAPAPMQLEYDLMTN